VSSVLCLAEGVIEVAAALGKRIPAGAGILAKGISGRGGLYMRAIGSVVGVGSAHAI